ncbi:MAG TPA: DMT family transporter [Thermodesulfobacteriota bacterium]
MLSALGAALAWAGVGLVARAMPPAASTLGVNAVRLVAAGALLLVAALAFQGPAAFARLTRTDLVLVGLSLLSGNAIGDSAFFGATRRLGLARAMALCMSYPIVAAVLARLALGEPLTAGLATGALLTVTGVAVILLSGSRTEGDPARFRAGVALSCLVIVSWALSSVVLKPALVRVDPVTAQGIRFLAAGTVLFGVLATRGRVQKTLGELAGYRERVVLAALLSALTGALFTFSLRHAGVGPATVLFATSPLFGVPLAWLVLGERPSPRALVGCALTVAGVAILGS